MSAERMDLTAALAMIRRAALAGHRAPTNADIAAALGCQSMASGARAVAALERRGDIRVTRGPRSRVIEAADGSWCTAGRVTGQHWSAGKAAPAISISISARRGGPVSLASPSSASAAQERPAPAAIPAGRLAERAAGERMIPTPSPAAPPVTPHVTPEPAAPVVTHRTCQFPTRTRDQGGWLFCSAPTVRGAWCADHAARVYVQRSEAATEAETA